MNNTRYLTIALGIYFTLAIAIGTLYTVSQPYAQPLTLTHTAIVTYACKFPTDGVLEAAAAAGVIVNVNEDC